MEEKQVFFNIVLLSTFSEPLESSNEENGNHGNGTVERIGRKLISTLLSRCFM